MIHYLAICRYERNNLGPFLQCGLCRAVKKLKHGSPVYIDSNLQKIDGPVYVVFCN